MKNRILTWASLFLLSFNVFSVLAPSAQAMSTSALSTVAATNSAGKVELCDTHWFNPLDWFTCGVIDMLQSFIEVTDGLLIKMLEFDTQTFFDPATGYKKAWSTFRYIAISILLITGLIIVISQALGFEILDAYTIKKTLPRLIIAVIGVSLSWPLSQFAVELFNTLGVDVRNLLWSPFHGLAGSGAGLTGSTAFGAGLFVGMAFLEVWGMLSFLATAALALLIGFLIIIFRNIALEILIILAPIAIVAYVLPNTQKIWKLWSSNIVGLLILFPLVQAIIAAGHIMAEVSMHNTNNPVEQIIGVIAYFAPYFFLPMMAKMAGGFLGNITGMVNDRSKGAFDRLSKYRQRKSALNFDRKVSRRALNARGKAYDALMDRASGSSTWLGKQAQRRLARGIGGYNIQAEKSDKQAAVNKEIQAQKDSGDDSTIRGLNVNKREAMRRFAAGDTSLMRVGADGTRQFQTLGGAWVNEASVDEAHARWGNDHFAQQAALSYEMSKATTQEQAESIHNNYASVARGWGMTRREANGALKGAGFENQGKHLQFKHSSVDEKAWRTGGPLKVSGEDMVKEAANNKNSYAVGNYNASSIKMLGDIYDAAGTPTSPDAERFGLDTKTSDALGSIKSDVSTTAETWMARGGGGASVMPTGSGDEVQTVPTGGTSGSRGYQAVPQGSGRANAAMRDLAVRAGVYTDLPPGPVSGSAADIDPQN